MYSVKHIADYLSKLSSAVTKIRFIALVGGTGLTIWGQYLSNSKDPWWASHADAFFWAGLITLLLTNFLLVFIDSQAIDTLKTLHEVENQNEEMRFSVEQLEADNEALFAWLTLTKLLSELLDQAIDADQIDEATKLRLYSAAVEFIANYKTRLFGIGDEYTNISIYEFDEDDSELKCVACYRSMPSDSEGPHRTWRSGEGHIGKAFELQRELVCADSRAADVSSWIAAPPGKESLDDEEKYVSLAAVPISITTDEPMGVVIMTSSEPYRFVNSNDVADHEEALHGKFAVESLQDIAAQIAQLMCILKSKQETEGEVGGEHGHDEQG